MDSAVLMGNGAEIYESGWWADGWRCLGEDEWVRGQGGHAQTAEQGEDDDACRGRLSKKNPQHWPGKSRLEFPLGLGEDAGDEVGGEFEGALRGVAGVGADRLVIRQGDDKCQDAAGWIAGRYGDGGGGQVAGGNVCNWGRGCVFGFLSIHIVFRFSGFSPFSRNGRGCPHSAGE